MMEVIGAALAGALLYRIRGGWLKAYWPDIGSTIGRVLWVVPTAALVTVLGGYSWLIFALLCGAVLASASLGHGAHMIYDAKMAKGLPEKHKTEMLTSWWLPAAWGGRKPDDDWSDDEVHRYNMMGMSFIGVVRNHIAVLPLVAIAPAGVALYAASGAAHGPLYWIGWRIRGGGIQVAELLVGAASWATLTIIFR